MKKDTRLSLRIHTHVPELGSLGMRLGECCVAHSEGCIWYRPKHHHYYKLKQEEKIYPSTSLQTISITIILYM